MLWAMPSRGVGRPARKIEEPDYWMISAWEKRTTTVTAHPRFIGDGMSNLTGSVAPNDHATYGHVKGHQKVDNVHIKVNYDPVTNPWFAALAARNRRRCGTLRCHGGSRQCSGGILVSQRLAPQRAKYLVVKALFV